MGAVGVELGGDVGVVLGDEGRRPLFERPAVLVRPPVVDCPVRVELRALVVEAVAYLVADDGADRAVVERVVAIGVEEGELQDGSGEDDLVPQGVVVGVDRLRRHEPFAAVHVLAEFGEVPGYLEARARTCVVEEVVADPEGGVISPLVRIADLGDEGVALLQGPPFRLVPHPVERADRLAVGLQEVVDEAQHPLLVGRREVPGDVLFADSLAEGPLDEAHAPLPPLALFDGSAQHPPVEVEVGVVDLLGEVRIWLELDGAGFSRLWEYVIDGGDEGSTDCHVGGHASYGCSSLLRTQQTDGRHGEADRLEQLLDVEGDHVRLPELDPVCSSRLDGPPFFQSIGEEVEHVDADVCGEHVVSRGCDGHSGAS